MTRLLNSLQETGSQAQEGLILRLYDELHVPARRKMARESPDHTLQTTARVHEVWLRLIAPSRTKWENRAEFFAAAAEAIRRILVDRGSAYSARSNNWRDSQGVCALLDRPMSGRRRVARGSPIGLLSTGGSVRRDARRLVRFLMISRNNKGPDRCR